MHRMLLAKCLVPLSSRDGSLPCSQTVQGLAIQRKSRISGSLLSSHSDTRVHESGSEKSCRRAPSPTERRALSGGCRRTTIRCHPKRGGSILACEKPYTTSAETDALRRRPARDDKRHGHPPCGVCGSAEGDSGRNTSSRRWRRNPTLRVARPRAWDCPRRDVSRADRATHGAIDRFRVNGRRLFPSLGRTVRPFRPGSGSVWTTACRERPGRRPGNDDERHRAACPVRQRRGTRIHLGHPCP